MFFINYSEQIMHLSFAFGAVLISVVLAWLIFSALSILNDVRHVINKIKATLAITHEVAKAAKEKVHDFSIQFKALASGFNTILDWVVKRKQENDQSKADEPPAAKSETETKN